MSAEKRAGRRQQAAGSRPGFCVQGSGIGCASTIPPSAFRLPPSSSSLPAASCQPPAARRLPPSAAARRGVLLLVILSLLILFVMLAVTYVLVAARHLSTNRILSRVEQTGDPPQQLLTGAIMQFVRGTNPDPTTQRFRSAIGPWSLLEHMYGMYTAQGSFGDNVPDSTNGQVIEFKTATFSAANPTYTLSSQLLDIDGYFDGCVITMTSGNARNLTSRIVRYDASVTPHVFHILAFKGPAGTVTPSKGDTFIINGRAFSGTGFGFNSTTGTVDAKNGDQQADGGRKEFALLPNPMFYDQGSSPATSDYTSGAPFGGLGGGNVDYTAPDYQNMYLAWLPEQGTTRQVVLPSFHRGDLINYWQRRMQNAAVFGSSWKWTTNPAGAALLRRIMLRPNPIDHPNFNGGNIYLDKAASFTQVGSGKTLTWQDFITVVDPATSQPYQVTINGTPTAVYACDVDNDGDGIADSMWLDLGYPVQSTIDGRLYKPLFAILCIDLDGCVNINASGTTEQIPVNATYTESSHDQKFVCTGSAAASPSAPNMPYVSVAYAGTSTSTPPFKMPRGEGCGPAEVNLLEAGIKPKDLEYLLRGIAGGTSYDGRYGELSLAGGGQQAGSTGTMSRLADCKRFQLPDKTFDPPNGVLAPLSSYTGPADLWGRAAVGLDYRGQPIYWKPDWKNEAFNSPYDINLSVGGPGRASGGMSADNPFSVYELEPLLRLNDIDSSGLPSRLSALLNTSLSNNLDPLVRHRLTTDSWDPPSPGVIAPLALQNELNTSSIVGNRRFATNIQEMLAARLQSKNASITTAQVSFGMRNLLAPELLAGLRMNINRPFGDGRDDNNNGVGVGVVDEPLPTFRQIRDGQTTNTEGTMEGKPQANSKWSWSDAYGNMSVLFNLMNSINIKGQTAVNPGAIDMRDQMLARHLMARNLFVLAMLMTDDGYFLDATTGNSNVQWFNETLSGPQKRELAVRRLAQWAVNVVDFLDSDNIMTPFEYDAYPFSNTDPTTGTLKVPGHPEITWAVDGIVDDGSGQLSQDDNKPWRRLVWGCESQPALLMETWAIHDRRVADTKFDDGNRKKRDDNNDGTADANEDLDLDQTRIPQGSAFFEIYATHNPYAAVQSADLYDYNAGNKTWYLNLGKTAPGDSNTPSYPVWRMVISESSLSNANNNVLQRLVQHADSASLEPEQYRGVAPTPTIPPAPTGAFSLLPNIQGLSFTGEIPNVQIDRIIWLAQLRPSPQHIDNDRIYFNRSNNTELGPGQYAVIGPRTKTVIGTEPGAQKWGNPSKMAITLTPNALAITNAAGQNMMPALPGAGGPTEIQAPLTLIVAGSIPANVMYKGSPAPWTGAGQPRSASFPEGIGINISEPLYSASNYYPEPKEADPANGGIKDAYGDLTETDNTKLFLDNPLDSRVGMPLKADGGAHPLETGTRLAYKYVFLQRLANPLAPYNPLSNPYLTIDWMPIDLTVCNGEDKQDANAKLPEDQWDPDDPNIANANVHLGTRERIDYKPGARNVDPTVPGTTPTFNIWTQATVAPDQTTKDPALTSIFKYDLKTTTVSLGYLNHGYGAPWKKTDSPAPPNDSYVGAAFAGAPQPFPWLPWNNRPYTSTAELLLVPASSPGRFMHEFALPTNGTKPYDDGATVADQRAPYPHLLNFFSSSKTAGKAPNLANMLEYLQVPSPFVGTETILNPTKFAWDFTAGGAEPAGTEGLHPPFNFVSNYRDPGKINVNTISNAKVWAALLGGDPNYATGQSEIPGPPYDNGPDQRKMLQRSRQGFGGAGFNQDHPSMFSNPFRSAAGAGMAPVTGPSATNAAAQDLRHKPANASLWRAAGNNPDTQNLTTLLAPSMTNGYTANQPTDGYRDPVRNPYFNYQVLDRLANKVTTRSNVYAVWITVGYFEVTPWTTAPGGPVVVDLAHPDGYQLGQEMGADTGEIERHRGFYIIDRSIPVGFQRGQDLNTNETVLLKRFIE